MITVEHLFTSYGMYLRAKVQLEECAGLGMVITDTFRKDIADHEALEARYLIQFKAQREARSAAFKAEMEAIDRAQPLRRLR